MKYLIMLVLLSGCASVQKPVVVAQPVTIFCPCEHLRWIKDQEEKEYEDWENGKISGSEYSRRLDDFDWFDQNWCHREGR